MDTSNNLALLFRRDLRTMSEHIRAFPSDEILWQTTPGITNSAGNLVLHIEGNLREYVGRQLGKIPYERRRELEFTSKEIGKEALTGRMNELTEFIPSVIGALSSKQMEAAYPEVVLEKPLSTEAFLIHLYGHLNWHLGQLDYLRRTLTRDGAVQRASL